MTEQLNFFPILERTAIILPFPPRRIDSLVKAAAARVHAAASKEQPQTLLNEVGLVMLKYLLLSFDEDTARGLAMDYQAAVQTEIHRLRWLGYQPNPKGAA